jgi:hypothetical protein
VLVYVGSHKADTRKGGLEEFDKVTQLADDLQMMGKWNARAAAFACIAAVADALIAFG